MIWNERVIFLCLIVSFYWSNFGLVVLFVMYWCGWVVDLFGIDFERGKGIIMCNVLVGFWFVCNCVIV